MPAQVDLSKLSVRQFAERFKSEMIPLSNTFSYFCASVPLSEEDLKEYLEEPVAALPPAIAAMLPRASSRPNALCGPWITPISTFSVTRPVGFSSNGRATT